MEKLQWSYSEHLEIISSISRLGLLSNDDENRYILFEINLLQIADLSHP